MAQETLRENKMGTMPENKLLLSMAVPMMISMLVQALYNIVDSIFVSRICEDALTAVSMAFPWQNIVISIAVGFGVGINALLSRALGQKNAERVNQVAVNGLLLAGLSYLLVLVAGLIGIRAYMRTQTDIETIVNYGITYLNICILCSFGVFVEITFERFLQATGRTVYSMITQLTGAITNIILDPILIFGLLGFPKLGIAGAAWATVIGQCQHHPARGRNGGRGRGGHPQSLQEPGGAPAPAAHPPERQAHGRDHGHQHPVDHYELHLIADVFCHEYDPHCVFLHGGRRVRRLFQAPELCVHAGVRAE